MKYLFFLALTILFSNGVLATTCTVKDVFTEGSEHTYTVDCEGRKMTVDVYSPRNPLERGMKVTLFKENLFSVTFLNSNNNTLTTCRK